MALTSATPIVAKNNKNKSMNTKKSVKKVISNKIKAKSKIKTGVLYKAFTNIVENPLSIYVAFFMGIYVGGIIIEKYAPKDYTKRFYKCSDKAISS